MNKFWESDVQHDDYNQHTRFYIFKRGDLKCSYHQKEMIIMRHDGDAS